MRHQSNLGSVPGPRSPPSGCHVPEEREIKVRISNRPQTQTQRLCEAEHVFRRREIISCGFWRGGRKGKFCRHYRECQVFGFWGLERAPPLFMMETWRHPFKTGVRQSELRSKKGPFAKFSYNTSGKHCIYPVGIFTAILEKVYSFLRSFIHYNAHTCINKLRKNLIDINLKGVAGKVFLFGCL